MSYIHPTQESGKKFFKDYSGKGKVTMLNLLKFKAIADYTGHEDIKPKNNITGKEAYNLYMTYTAPLLEKAGSKLSFIGTAGDFVIGPENEAWDLMLLVEHESVEKFIAFTEDPEYLKTGGHRTAALADSRLLPLTNLKS